MKNKRVIIVIVFILIETIILNAFTLNVKASPKEGKKIEVFIEKNENLLSEENKVTLKGIIEKLNKYEVLTQDEREYIRECEFNVIREKLGDVQFEEYKKLLEKRRKSVEFDQVDRIRLYELEKLLK